MLQAIIDSAQGEAKLPPGRFEISAPLIPRIGVDIIGAGGHDPTGPYPGTELVPAPGYDGPLIHWSGGALHNASIQRLRVSNSRSHGIHIEGPTGECFLIDRVTAKANAGHGIYIGPTIPCVIGHVSVHLNGRAGLAFSNPSIVQVGFVSGDNNGTALVHVERASTSSIVNILGFKSERWNNVSPGNPDVFLIENLNGGLVNIGSGRVHIGANVPAGHAIIYIRGGQYANVRISPIARNPITGTQDYRDTEDYQYGLVNEITGDVFTVDDMQRRAIHFTSYQDVFLKAN